MASGFGGVRPKVSKRSNTFLGMKQRTYIENLYHDAIHFEKEVRSTTLPRMRPSSFPMCSIKTWVKMIEMASVGSYKETQSASGSFFCDVGTTAHEVFQYYMGMSGVIFGDWKCITKGCVKSKGKKLTRKATTKNTCPRCKEAMRYEEVEVFHNGIFAHVDCLIKLPKKLGGGWWVLDYKTATKMACSTMTAPKVAHTYQIPTYVYMLRKVLNLDIVGYSLLYISRDNPFEYKSIEINWDNKEENRIKRLLKKEKVKFYSALQGLKSSSIEEIVDAKPCGNKEEYEAYSFYSECEFVDVCFSRPLLENKLLKLQKKYPYSEKAGKLLHKQISEQEKPK